MLWNYRVATQLVGSRVVLSSIELVSANSRIKLEVSENKFTIFTSPSPLFYHSNSSCFVPHAVSNIQNKTTLRSWTLLETPSVAQLLKNFPIFYGIRMFITLYKEPSTDPLSWARSIQFIPTNPISKNIKPNIFETITRHFKTRGEPSHETPCRNGSCFLLLT
jgi:hypothetical protein